MEGDFHIFFILPKNFDLCAKSWFLFVIFSQLLYNTNIYALEGSEIVDTNL